MVGKAADDGDISESVMHTTGAVAACGEKDRDFKDIT
jgi:hypothetical protein